MEHSHGYPQEDILEYDCFCTPETITVDGNLNEPAWLKAPKSPRFGDLVTGKPGILDTRAALLWDARNLYVAFWIEEPDVWATLTERDSYIWQDNDVEIFIAGRDAYYEFEINALGTVYEAMWIWKDVFRKGGRYDVAEFDLYNRRVTSLGDIDLRKHPRGPRWGFLDWDFPGLQARVKVDGTLNKRDDLDRGWTVEIAFPWEGMKWLAEGRPLPPREGDVWRMDFSRFQNLNFSSPASAYQPDPDEAGLSVNAAWVWNKHGVYDTHIPERFTKIRFTEEAVS